MVCVWVDLHVLVVESNAAHIDVVAEEVFEVPVFVPECVRRADKTAKQQCHQLRNQALPIVSRLRFVYTYV